MAEKAVQRPDRAVPMDSLWTEDAPERATGEPALVIDVAGFEGPLDLLLHLARNQKVDLARISIVALVDQYLAFIDRVAALTKSIAKAKPAAPKE